jgi:hypothetical protein
LALVIGPVGGMGSSNLPPITMNQDDQRLLIHYCYGLQALLDLGCQEKCNWAFYWPGNKVQSEFRSCELTFIQIEQLTKELNHVLEILKTK